MLLFPSGARARLGTLAPLLVLLCLGSAPARAQTNVVEVRASVPEVLTLHVAEERPAGGAEVPGEVRTTQALRVSANAPWELLVRTVTESTEPRVWWRLQGADGPGLGPADAAYRPARAAMSTLSAGEPGRDIPLHVELRRPAAQAGSRTLLRYTLIAR